MEFKFVRGGKKDEWIENSVADNMVFFTGLERRAQTKITAHWEMGEGGSERKDDRWTDG